MIEAHATPAKVFTDLTCWKCGEESLKEASGIVEAFNAKGEKTHTPGNKHSDCQKCGAYSVNPAQAHFNKLIARQNRKAIIKEANRMAS